MDILGRNTAERLKSVQEYNMKYSHYEPAGGAETNGLQW